MSENEISNIVIGCALKVHSALGPGLLESAYEECLYFELLKTNLKVEKQKAMPLMYEGVKLDCGYRIDLMVENKVVIELKSVETLSRLHASQVVTYLKLSNCKLGMLLNFNVEHMKDGIKRIAYRM